MSTPLRGRLGMATQTHLAPLRSSCAHERRERHCERDKTGAEHHLENR